MLDLPDLFAYSEWATGALLDAAALLPEADWTRDLGGSFPTLQAVFEHVAGGEWVWLARWTGRAPTAFPAWTGTTTPGTLAGILAGIAAERRVWMSALAPATIEAPHAYTLLNGTAGTEPLGVQMHHVANHGTYHRGQAAAMLRRVGVVPPPTDLIAWARAGQPRRA